MLCRRVGLPTGVVASAIIGGGGYASPVTSCYNLATLVSSKSGYGTIIGDSWGSERIYNCYTAHGYKICRGTGACVVENSYSISEAPGKAAATSMAGLGGDYVLTDGYPVLKVFGKDTEIWGGFKSAPIDADEDGVYEINSPEELAYIASGNGAENSYVLTNDIYLNDTEAVDWTTGEVNEGYSPNEWYENKTFKGTFDGNGHTVYGLYYPVLNNKNEDGTSAIDYNSPIGLFPLTGVNTTVTNVAVKKSYLVTVGFAGAIVGFFSDKSEANILIDNCYSDETVTIKSYKPSASDNYQFGSGRFTGGFLAYTPREADITITGCYIDDSCAVWGWNSGAAYVDDDSDIGYQGETGKLCMGILDHTEYKESATGTYILDGETYRTFTAADYEGTKYTYDEETDTYTESESGTYLLDGETYRLITVDDYTGTRYAVDDLVFKNAYFTSTALGGIIARLESTATGFISNCYATADISSKTVMIYGYNSQGVTWAKEGANGGSSSHVGGIWGDDWGSTVEASNCFSVINGHENVANATLPLTTAGASYIYGGGNTGTVYGDTKVNVSGSVNEPLDYTSHTAIARLYGGSQNGNVKGSTFVSITENAEFSYIYGGCKSGTVGVATNIDFSGKAMSIYGGSGTVTETNVTVNDGGWVHQVFGGLEGGTMTGNTNVTIKGGYIDRRIVGGCYNACDVGLFKVTWNSERYVTGTCTVTLYDEATYNLSGDDHGITALSRHSTNHEEENGVLVFENQTLYNNLKNDLGIDLIFDSVPQYDSYTIAQ